ncbi:MAG TPA: hypothetical protein VF534_01255 [Paraburkholderia sp.]
MDATKLNQLREMAQDTNGEIDRALVLELITEHETQQRAESFWSERAPALNDEVVYLRQVETNARALKQALVIAASPADRMTAALNELDSWRMNRAET